MKKPTPLQVARYSTILPVSALLWFGLTACAPAPDQPDTTAQAPSRSEQGTDAEFDAWQLKLAGCMRDEGLDFPDPQPGGDQSIPMPEGDESAFMTAMDSCVKQLGDPPAREGASAEQALDAQLKIAECFRDAGYAVADPTPDAPLSVPQSAPEALVEKCLASSKAQS